MRINFTAALVAVEQERLRPGHLAALVCFRVGYSWGATLVQWPILGYTASVGSS